MAASKPNPAPSNLLKVVVVGGGFGGLDLVRHLASAPVAITLVDRNNHHVFQPLLYQVATAALPPADIAQPIRDLLKGSNITVRLDEAVGLDLHRRQLKLRSGGMLEYDVLVLASGVEYTYFGHNEWAAFAPSLKTVKDARDIRERLLSAFEDAENTSDLDVRRRLLTFVLVGGGPTGVELAGSIAELARYALRKNFKHFDPASARVILVESEPRLLSGFTDDLADYALRALQRLHVEIRLSARVSSIDADGVRVGAEKIAAGLVIWCAGVKGTKPASWLPVTLTKHGTVPVSADLSVPGHSNIFVIGDLASVQSSSGEPLPQVAAVAKQEAHYVAEVLRSRLNQTKPPAPFTYRNYGMLAVVGRSAAVAQFNRIRLKGTVGWLVWGLAHIFFLIGFRNRTAVFVSWFWEWWTNRRGARLIIGSIAAVQGKTDQDKSQQGPGATEAGTS
jgi:NADH dehydrogenase